VRCSVIEAASKSGSAYVPDPVMMPIDMMRDPSGPDDAGPGATEGAYRWVADHRSTPGHMVSPGVKRSATERIARHGA
jgi:hypothetical protein